MSVAAIIFDFDGVIVESVDIKTRAFADLFANESDAVRAAVVDYHLRNAGLSRYAKFDFIHEELLGRPLDSARMKALDRRFSELVVDAVASCPMVPGAAAFLDRRHGQVPLFVVSGTPEGELRDILARRGLDRYFVESLGSPTSKTDNVRAILSRHGLRAPEVVLIGDGRQDFEAARALGLRFVGRATEGRPSPFPPDVPTVPDLAALERCWDGLAGTP